MADDCPQHCQNGPTSSRAGSRPANRPDTITTTLAFASFNSWPNRTFPPPHGELLGLRLIDVDLDEGLIHVRGQVVTQKGLGQVRKVQKTPAGRRTLAIPDGLIPALKDWLEVRSRIGLDKHGDPKPGWVDSGYFFISQNGTPLIGRNMRRPFHRIREQAGLRHQTPHGLRHFFATQQMLARENPRIVQAQLGHSRVGVTLDIYSHVAGLERQSMNRVTDLLLDSPKEKSG